MLKKIFAIVICLVIAYAAWGVDPGVEDVLNKIATNQSLIKDMQADVITVIKAEMKEKKESRQKGKIWVKGDDKSKMEMIEPVKQVTITSGDKMAMIDPATGQKFVQDLKKLREKNGQVDLGQGSKTMDKKKMYDFFNLKLVKSSGKQIIIEGNPKKANKFLGKVNFYVDTDRYLPVKIEIYNPTGGVVSTSDIEYAKINNIWVISKSVSEVKLPGGKMKAEMRFENIKVNEGISDSVFKID
ncbi:MAG: outer membrane lipoprotein-sorting protein [Candidatus Margulisiibacteriota bacterium]